MALPTRFISTWRSRPASPTSASGHLLVHHGHQLEALVVRPLRQDVADALDRLAEVEVELLQLQPSRLDLGEVEDVVDDVEQRLGRDADGLGVALLLGRERRSCSSSWVMPTTPFIGVRISWLMLARNCDLARLASSACRASSRASRVVASSWLVRSSTFCSSPRWYSSTSPR